MPSAIPAHKIRNLWCIGRNYSDHAKELGNAVPEKPLVFLKAGTTIQPAENEIVFPTWAKNIHYELELALQWDESLNFSQACLAIDFTERDKQTELKTKGHPWSLAKSFTGGTAISGFFAIDDLESLEGFEMKLNLNDEQRQHGFLRDLIFPIQTLKDYVEEHFPIAPGDLLLTGTPAGVGQVSSEDRIDVTCNRGVSHRWVVKQPQMRPE